MLDHLLFCHCNPDNFLTPDDQQNFLSKLMRAESQAIQQFLAKFCKYFNSKGNHFLHLM